jgi:hypothetical protein
MFTRESYLADKCPSRLPPMNSTRRPILSTNKTDVNDASSGGKPMNSSVNSAGLRTPSLSIIPINKLIFIPSVCLFMFTS